MSLSASDLGTVISHAVRDWREIDERRGALQVLDFGRISGTLRDDALELAEMSEMAVAAYGRGESLHDAEYVKQRYSDSELEPPWALRPE